MKGQERIRFHRKLGFNKGGGEIEYVSPGDYAVADLPAEVVKSPYFEAVIAAQWVEELGVPAGAAQESAAELEAARKENDELKAKLAEYEAMAAQAAQAAQENAQHDASPSGDAEAPNPDKPQAPAAAGQQTQSKRKGKAGK